VEFLSRLRPTDRLLITADHGNDPTAPGSDHTREYVPVLALNPAAVKSVDLGTRESFADFAATLAEAFGLEDGRGRSFWPEMEEAVHG
jgi:phosphopentomutase